MSHNQGRELEPRIIREFEELEVKLSTFHDELSNLSKKSPDGSLNKFKLTFLNDTLVRVNSILGELYRPFSDFESFSDEDLPSNSDVVLMLSHYLKSMERYRSNHSTGDIVTMWCVKGGIDAEESN